MKHLFCVFVAAFAAASFLFLPAPAQAEGQSRSGVIVLDDLIVEGTVHKPGLIYVLSRSRLQQTEQDRPPSFVNEVVESVETDPF